MKFDILDKSGKVIFMADVDCDETCDTSIKIGLAVNYAIRHKINLIGADLRGVDLSGTELRGINLSQANLSYTSMRDADLSYTDLGYASLSGAELYGTNLSYASLSGANLRDTDLSYANLSCADLRVLQTDIWTCYIQKEYIRIGCQFFTVDEWLRFSDKEISKMDSNALAWWKVWKPILLSIADTLKG
jgi:hypothetical protein